MRATGWDELRIRCSCVAFGWACAAGTRGPRVPRREGGGSRGEPRSCGRARARRALFLEELAGCVSSRSGLSAGLAARHDRLADEGGPPEGRLPENPDRVGLAWRLARACRG